jgi:enoyl-[acyl-carrier protein] reductase/trans-2-enoyl-CoA reductase (NAD+)
MIIQPKIRGFICTTAHPIGCAKVVEAQINYVKAQTQAAGPKNVLIIGGSTGYGLASRIMMTFGFNAKTISVAYEKGADEKRTASAGWYNTAAFETYAHQENRYAKSINGDAFSHQIKKQTADLIKQDFGKVDLIIYSLASPRRVHPDTEQIFSSVLKPIGQTFTGKTVDPIRGEVKEITLEPATADEIAQTVAVMGGEDWEMWLDFLAQENVLAEGVKTIAYDYVGPALTYPIYKEGTIGKAKEHLLQTAAKLQTKLQRYHGQALLSVNKALVTQASSAIPVVPLYISLLYKIMKEKGTHEGCIEQMNRLFKNIYATSFVRDKENRIRLDDLEMQSDVQEKIIALWPTVNSENLEALTDIAGYRDEFHRLFGFGVAGIDYTEEVDPEVGIASIE